MADFDDLDDPLELKRAHLEARFRELEEQAELEELKRRAGQPPPPPNEPRRPSTEQAAPEAGPDPLEELKSRVAGKRDAASADAATEATRTSRSPERYLLLLCPHCQAKNRARLSRVRTQLPVCGACKKDLAIAS